jgi:hypothetical protein
MSTGDGSILGRVVDSAGAPISGAVVAVDSGTEPHRDLAALTSPDGTFHLRGMQPGSYTLMVRAKNSTRLKAGVVVSAGAGTSVEIQLDV